MSDLRFGSSIAVLMIALAVVLSPLASQPRSPRQFHVTGQAIPTSAASPAALEGGTLNTDVNVDFLVISNTDSSSHTVTVVDCTAVTPFSLFTASPIAALTVWPVPLGNMR